MPRNRVERLNSSLREVISDIIRRDVRNPHVKDLFTITRVSISKDLRHAKVYVSVIGTEEEKKETIEALQTAAGFIGIQASKEIVIRYFPDLRFILDDSAVQHARIEELLHDIHKEQQSREDHGRDSTDQ